MRECIAYLIVSLALALLAVAIVHLFIGLDAPGNTAYVQAVNRSEAVAGCSVSVHTRSGTISLRAKRKFCALRRGDPVILTRSLCYVMQDGQTKIAERQLLRFPTLPGSFTRSRRPILHARKKLLPCHEPADSAGSTLSTRR